MKIRTGDTVLVINGKDRGKSGTVLRVLPLEGRVVVGGINMRTKHVKKTYQQAGRKLQYEASIHISKVMILDPKTSKPARVGYLVKDGKKKRISRISGEEIVKVKPKVEKKEKKPKTPTTPTSPKKEEKSSVSSVPSASSDSSKKQPFWKRMKFGAAAMEDVEMPEQSNMEKDHSIPDQQIHVRKGSRGS